MDHFSHEHPLILNEDYVARGGDMCNACNEEIVSCKSFVFSCSRSSSITGITSTDHKDVDGKCNKFLLHKTCAESPRRIQSLRNREEFLDLRVNIHRQQTWEQFLSKRPAEFYTCNMCMKQMPWIYCSPGFVFCVCLKCAMFQVDYFISRKIKHQSHTQHQLALIQRPSSFKCDACNAEDSIKDMSYKCVDCPFWIHKSCADAPTSFLFHFHKKHPLMLSFSLPQIHHKFAQHCRLCNGKLGELNWLYYCSKCRYFAHFQCARSRQMLSSSENEEYPELVHLPAATESSVNLLFEQFIKEMNGPKNEEGCSTRLKDWAHVTHPLQLVTHDELHDEKDLLLMCDGCARPIRNDGHVFYACVPCQYFLHKFCGELPTTDHQIIPSYELFRCDWCQYLGNGIYFRRDLPRNSWLWDLGPIKQHIACSALPKMIKHDSHPHPLHFNSHYTTYCKACGGLLIPRHGCEGCDFHLCAGCIMKPSRVKHRWDPHPLRLIFDPGMVEDHEHEFHYVMINHVISTSHMSSLVLLILLKTISIITASHLYSIRSFVVAENVTTVILAGLSLNVHHAKPHSVGSAPICCIRFLHCVIVFKIVLYLSSH
nr:PREDICTED: uncharacterized protein LOC108225048 [Daucus carota subsp. sativus]